MQGQLNVIDLVTEARTRRPRGALLDLVRHAAARCEMERILTAAMHGRRGRLDEYGSAQPDT